MSNRSNLFCLETWGEFACFTRPECKVERFSYPIPTPSSVKGIFSSIYLKPSKFNWIPTKVQVLNKIAYINLRKNELDSIARPCSTDAEAINVNEHRTQRQTQALWNVRYRMWARLDPINGNNLTPLTEQFLSRVKKGQFHAHPCFGLKEFMAFFELVPNGDAGTPCEKINLSPGRMLYDVFDQNDRSKIGTISPSFFCPEIKDNIYDIPDFNSSAVSKICR